MKPSDTVMSPQQIMIYYQKWSEGDLHGNDTLGDFIARTQAEITWKAGCDETNKQWIMALKRKGIIVTEPSQLEHIWIATLGERRERPKLVIGDD